MKGSDKETSISDRSTPELVRGFYDIAIQVRPISNELYAVQLRKTLEAICENLGAPRHLPSGETVKLWDQINKLGKQNVLGEFISKVAHELRAITNSGAHYSKEEVREGDIRKLELLLALITNYIYGSQNPPESLVHLLSKGGDA
jgi:hypothetical protein